MSVVYQKMALMFLVDNVDEAVSYYEQVLGAKLQYSLPQTRPFEWASLLLGGVEIMFWLKDAAQREYLYPLPISKEPANFIAYFYVDNVEALYDQVKDRARVLAAPKDQPYGIREFTVLDPFGFLLTFAELKG